MIGKTNIIGVGKYLGEVFEFAYTGDVQEFVVPVTGRYLIECSGSAATAKGAKISAVYKLRANTRLYVYVGNNTWNGSQGYGSGSYNDACSSGSGSHKITWKTTVNSGGNSDVRLIKSSATDKWSGEESLESRLLIGAGGGGQCHYEGYNKCTYDDHDKEWDCYWNEWNAAKAPTTTSETKSMTYNSWKYTPEGEVIEMDVNSGAGCVVITCVGA